MDSDEEFLSFSDDIANPSSPILPGRKLKRLKKAAAEHVPEQRLPTTLSKAEDDSAPTHSVSSPGFESPETSEKNGEEFDGVDERSASPLKDFEWGREFDSIFNGPGGGDESRNAAESDSTEEEIGGNGDGEDMLGFDSTDENFGGTAEDGESSKKRRRRLQDEFDELEEDSDKKKNKKKRAESSVDNDGFDDLPFSIPSTKTERRVRLTELRIESQRLLRETGVASFKPAPLVRKPVFSLLEKIRQRKLEVSKKSINVKETSTQSVDGDFQREVELDFDFENASSENMDDPVAAKAVREDAATSTVHLGIDNLDIPIAKGFKDFSNQSGENLTSIIGSNNESRQTFRAPVDDTQDLNFESQPIDSNDETPGSPLDEVAAPPLLSLNLKLDTAPPDDLDSDEENNEKENIDPGLHRMSESPKADPMKAFVDDEAEEEDDSDNDLSRFKDDEEDLESMDSDELNDIIATGYEEKPVDNEIRNQLHQQWLEQQDATGTEKLLQKLKFGPKNVEMAVSEEKEDEEGDEEEEEDEDADETTENYVTQNVVRSNLKKAKEMICQMFTEKDDLYVSSDEETEVRIAKQQLSDRAEQQGTFLSPAEDEGSKEIFGRIKKLNNVHHNRKKAKITSYFHTLSTGGNGTIPSKSSFVGRGARNSIPSFGKNGPTNARAFVFERGNSNSSRSAIAMSEDSSDAMQRETRPRKTASARLSSQVTCSSQNSRTRPNPGPSLHEILRAAPLQPSNSKNDSSRVGEVEAIYAAFKVDQNLIKKERSVSIRTV